MATTIGAQTPRSRVGQMLAVNRLGVPAVIAIVGGAIAPLTVVAGGATTAWLVAGVIAIPLAYLVVALLLMLFSAGYTAMSQGQVSAGPLYTFPTKGLGRPVGAGSGMVALLAYTVMQAGLVGGFGAVATPFASDLLGWTAPWWVWALGAWAVIGVLGVLNIEWVGRVLAVLLAAEVLVTVVLAVVMFAHPAGGHVSFTAISPAEVTTAGFGAALAVAVAGFVGFEATSNLSEESKNPRRTIPLATFAALAIVGVVYAGASLAMVVAAGNDNIIKASGAGTDTMFNLAAPYVPDLLITLGRLLLLSSLFAAALAFHSVVSRYWFTLGREHLLPAWLARTGARSHAPATASVLQSVICLGVIALYVTNGWDPLTQLFYQLTVLGGFGVLLLMIVSSAAIGIHFSRRRNRYGRVSVMRGIIAPALSVIMLGVVLVETIQQIGVLLGLAGGDPLLWIYPSSFGVVFAIGVIWALVLRHTRPHVYQAIGTSQPPEPPIADRRIPATTIGGW